MSPASYQTAPPRDVVPPANRPHRPTFESGKRDSNPRPQPWQGCALPTELFPRLRQSYRRQTTLTSAASLYALDSDFQVDKPSNGMITSPRRRTSLGRSPLILVHTVRRIYAPSSGQ